MLKFQALGLVGPSCEIIVTSDVKPVTSVVFTLEKSEMVKREDVHGGKILVITGDKIGTIAKKGHFSSVFGTAVKFTTTITPVVILNARNNFVPFFISFPFARLNIDEFSLKIAVFKESHVEARRHNNRRDIVIESLGKVSGATDSSIETSFVMLSIDIGTRSPGRMGQGGLDADPQE